MTTDDQKFIHDLRNGIMVIKNLSKMLADGTMKGDDKTRAEKLVQQECDKVIELLKEK